MKLGKDTCFNLFCVFLILSSGYFNRIVSGNTEIETIFETCVLFEKGEISIDKFVENIHNIIVGGPPEQINFEYWRQIWNNRENNELCTNLFNDTNIPIVGSSSKDSSPARTLSMLIIRKFFSTENKFNESARRISLFGECNYLESGGDFDWFIINIYRMTIGVEPTTKSYNWWKEYWEKDPNKELETNKFSETEVAIIENYENTIPRSRIIAFLIIRSQISYSANMKYISGTFSWTYPISVFLLTITSIILLLIRGNK